MAVPRRWATLQYFDSREVLTKLRAIEMQIADVPMKDRVRQLRTGNLRPYNERRQAALFCYGMSCRIGIPVAYAPVEEEDYDCVARWQDGDTLRFARIQTKELVPEELNAKTSLETEIRKLSKYVDSEELTVALYLNRVGRFDLAGLNVPRLRIGELWLYGATTPDQSQWMLYGDVLSDPRAYAFTYPT